MANPYSSGSTVGWRYILESTFNTTPTTAWKALRAKASKMSLKKDTYTSDEVRADRGISDLRHGFRKVEGDIAGDLITGLWDDFFQYALMDASISNQTVQMGTTLNTISLEQQFTDLPQYRVYSGCAISKMKVSAKPGSLVEVDFTILGADSAAISGSPAAGATTAATTNSPLSYAQGVINEGGSAIAYVTGVDFELDNGTSSVGVIGANVTPGLFTGRSSIKGTVTALFKDATMLNKFMNETESSLYLQFTDLITPALSYIFNLPRIKYTGGDIAPPKDGATIITLPFEAILAPKIVGAACTSMAVSAVTGPGTFTLTQVAGTSYITQGFKAGQIVTASNLTTGANNGDWLITNVAAQILTCQCPTGLSTTLQAAGAFGNGVGDMTVNATNMSITRT